MLKHIKYKLKLIFNLITDVKLNTTLNTTKHRPHQKLPGPTIYQKERRFTLKDQKEPKRTEKKPKRAEKDKK